MHPLIPPGNTPFTFLFLMLMLLESTLYLWAFNENRLKYNKHVNRSDFGASLCFPAACMALFLWSAYNSSLRMLYPNSWAGKPKRLKHLSSQIHKMNQYQISNCVFFCPVFQHHEWYWTLAKIQPQPYHKGQGRALPMVPWRMGLHPHALLPLAASSVSHWLLSRG